ncbi:MAG: hypothetical protein CVU57_09260 [Deltaproteobacteria bacterium HGW-Deltaproteobacteria-15]|jgi:hypothetical protein|nr:MAG: hypothetical protein CVU57_09260 [Deltaproteobacteria bacterium HGW-Deltaproteobacteria-15]
MCEFLLCLQLRDSLDAAFRGGVYEGAESIGAWGRAVVDAFQDHKSRYSLTLLWQIANDSLRSIIVNCPCEELAQGILSNPGAFVRTTMILASRCPSTQEPVQSVVLH